MIEMILFISLIVLALITVQSDNLMRTVIYSGAFSLVMALLFLYYNAPDVALAEAAIGVGLSTIMYLVALKKVKVYDICIIDHEVEVFDDETIDLVNAQAVKPLEYFLEKTVELEPQLTYTSYPLQTVLENEDHNVVIKREGDLYYLYGYLADVVFQDIVNYLKEIVPENIDRYRIIYLDQGEMMTDEVF